MRMGARRGSTPFIIGGFKRNCAVSTWHVVRAFFSRLTDAYTRHMRAKVTMPKLHFLTTWMTRFKPIAGRGLVTALLGASLGTAQAAGVQRIVMAGAPADSPVSQALLWTPCAKPSEALTLGPFVVRAVKDCEVQAPQKLPLVVISHGFASTNLSHHDVATALADSGFAVLSINHSLDSLYNMAQAGTFAALAVRPSDVQRAINALLAHTELGPKVDAQRIGLFGFSRGAYTGLLLAGAQPDFLRAQLGCTDMRIPICQDIRDRKVPPIAATPDPRIKAYVLADPLAAFPDKASLAQVRAPVQMWASELGGEFVVPQAVQAQAQQLPSGAELHVVKGASHFAFLPPCTPQMAAQAGEICTDPPGFDRAAFQQQFITAVRRFFQQKL